MGLGTQGRVPGPCAAPQAPLSQLLWDGDRSGGPHPCLPRLFRSFSLAHGRLRWEGPAEMGGAGRGWGWPAEEGGAGGGRRPRWEGPADGACGGPHMCVQNW